MPGRNGRYTSYNYMVVVPRLPAAIVRLSTCQFPEINNVDMPAHRKGKPFLLPPKAAKVPRLHPHPRGHAGMPGPFIGSWRRPRM